MDMISVNEPAPARERSYRAGSRPKIVLGAHFDPTSGAAGSRAPHHIDSAATYEGPSPPNVRNTEVAPWALTFTPVGFTRICALRARVVLATPAIENTASHTEHRMSEDPEGKSGTDVPSMSVDRGRERHGERLVVPREPHEQLAR